MLEIYLPLFILLLLLHYSAFLLMILKGLKKLSPPDIKKAHEEFISVIIPFRNESGNILNNLKSIEAQNYPKDKFEVIYVNDFSNDDSLEILNKEFKSGNIKVLSVPTDFTLNAHKKRAVRFGIENSAGSIIFTSDADCIQQPFWLTEMMNCFDDNTGFVSGPVEFYDKPDFWSGIQKAEFAGLVLAGAGLIGNNTPVICNAANIAYRKEAFAQVGGFKGNMNLSSGDDEFLMQKIWKETRYKVKFCLSRKALVKTNPNLTFEQFYHQRKRWASKGLFYADKFLVLKLILIFFYYLSLITLPFFAVIISLKYLTILIFSIIVKFVIEYRILKTGAGMIFSKAILRYFFLAEILQVPYIIVAAVSGIFGNFTWKDRKVKR